MTTSARGARHPPRCRSDAVPRSDHVHRRASAQCRTPHRPGGAAGPDRPRRPRGRGPGGRRRAAAEPGRGGAHPRAAHRPGPGPGRVPGDRRPGGDRQQSPRCRRRRGDPDRRGTGRRLLAGGHALGARRRHRHLADAPRDRAAVPRLRRTPGGAQLGMAGAGRCGERGDRAAGHRLARRHDPRPLAAARAAGAGLRRLPDRCRLPDGTGRPRPRTVTETGTAGRPSAALRRVLVPLALAQFICSFAGSNMNVMITDMAEDLDTTVQGIQVAITIFLLVMAALMIPGGKLTDKYGRKRMLIAGLIVYGVGAVVSAVAPGLGVLIVGNSILEGVGTAMLIPPVYILTTLLFTNVTSRARAFGAISAMGGLGAAAGPLIGGVIASAISWRAAFVFQALVIVVIVVLSRNVKDPLPADPPRSFDVLGAVLSAAGLILIVSGTLAADDNVWLMLALIVIGALVLAWFFVHVRTVERAGREPLLSTSLFRNRTANLGMVTQNIQWLMLIGTSFTVAAYLQVVRGYGPIQTGVIFTAATVGVLISSLAAQRLAQRRAQRTLIMAGFVLTIAGIGVFLAMVGRNPAVWAFAPGLFLIGLGIGLMLTPSVNVVQSSFGEQQQGEISGVSRSVSNLGSSLGTAIAGTILVAGLTTRAYGLAMAVLAGIGIVGLVAAVFLPRTPAGTTAPPA